MQNKHVMPAKAGIHGAAGGPQAGMLAPSAQWTPAFAGVTTVLVTPEGDAA
jgi:hypothetical protein